LTCSNYEGFQIHSPLIEDAEYGFDELDSFEEEEEAYVNLSANGASNF